MLSHSPRLQRQDAYLLGPLLTDRARPTTVVLDDPALIRVWRKVGKLMTIDEFVAGRYLDPRYSESNSGEYVREILGTNTYVVPLSSVQALLQISDIARSQGVKTIAVQCRTLRAENMANSNLVFLGGIGSDPWVGEIQKHLAFQHSMEPASDRRIFINRSPHSGEQQAFESSLEANRLSYARIALLRNPFGTGKVALLGGTSREATEAAIQFALSPGGLDKVRAVCGTPVEKLDSFELLLEIKSLVGTPVVRTVVAGRCNGQYRRCPH